MAVELVRQPYVALVGHTKFEYTAVAEFAYAHGLKDLIEQDDTPIGKIGNSGETDSDLMSEFAGRFCYRAWAKGRASDEYIKNILSEGHGNVLGHVNYSFIITGVSRSLSHELIRHHVGTNPSQESQRYVTAEGGEIEVVGYKAMRAVVPPMILAMSDALDAGLVVEHNTPYLKEFAEDFETCLNRYNNWLAELKAFKRNDHAITKKQANEAARCFLPNACETRLFWTMNARAARWIIEQRGSIHADLEIRRLACELARQLKHISPLIFQDVTVEVAEDGFEAVKVEFHKP